MASEEYPKASFYRRIVQAKVFIDNRYADGIDVDNIADEACFSKYHFIREFKKVYGKSPHRYLITVRIEKARQLLQAGQPVSDVCFAVGFESVSSFSGLFKRMTGVTPSGYLEQQQVIKKEMSKIPLKFIPNCFAQQSGWMKTAILEK